MNKETAIYECKHAVKSTQNSLGQYVLNADMLDSIIELAFSMGESAGLDRVPEIIDRAIENTKKQR